MVSACIDVVQLRASLLCLSSATRRRDLARGAHSIYCPEYLRAEEQRGGWQGARRVWRSTRPAPVHPSSRGVSEDNNAVTFRMRHGPKIFEIFSCEEHYEFVSMPNMTKNNEKIPAVVRRVGISFIRGAAAIIMLSAILGTVHGQAFEISGSEQPAAGTWQRLVNQPTFLCDTALLLTDGRVMVHQYGDPNHNGQGMNNWWALTPDVNGSYLNGTWSQLASMSSSYGPLYFASAVLPDGQLRASLLCLSSATRRPGDCGRRRI